VKKILLFLGALSAVFDDIKNFIFLSNGPKSVAETDPKLIIKILGETNFSKYYFQYTLLSCSIKSTLTLDTS